MQPLSPELALVDDELRQTAWEPRPYQPANNRTSVPQPQVPRGHGRRDANRYRASVLTAAALVLLTPALLATDAPSRQGDPAAASRSFTAAPVIAWRPVESAFVYNVILYRGDSRIDFWSSDNELSLNSGAGPRVGPGSYSWFVYPGFRKNADVRYDALLAHGTVVVAPQS